MLWCSVGNCAVTFSGCNIAVIDKLGAVSPFVVHVVNLAYIVAHGFSIRKFGGQLRGVGPFFLRSAFGHALCKAVVVFDFRVLNLQFALNCNSTW